SPRAALFGPAVRVIVGTHRAHLLGHLELRGIELRKGPLHGAVTAMAGITARGLWQHLGGIRQALRAVEGEISPSSILETLAVLHGRFQRRMSALRPATVVDGGIFHRLANFQHEYSVFRPSAGLHELAIRMGMDEHIVEARRLPRLRLGRSIGHAETARQEDPFPIVRRPLQLIPCIELRTWPGSRGSGRNRRSDRNHPSVHEVLHIFFYVAPPSTSRASSE